MTEKNETFSYAYSASQQEEIEAIKRKYSNSDISDKSDKMERLRSLDKSVTTFATGISISIGVFFSLLMGFGMSIIMTDLNNYLKIPNPFITGIIIGVIGMSGIISAYPIYHAIIKIKRKKIAPEILRLADELTEK